MRRAALLALAALLLVAAGCGGDDSATTAASPTTSAAAPATEPSATTEAPATSEEAPATTEDGATETVDPAEPSGESSGEASTSEDASGVVAYLVQNERISPVRRQAGGGSPARTAIEALLAGPTADDGGRTTAIPEGTELRDVAIDDQGILTVDLSEPFGSGGGSLSMQLRVAQVVNTAFQFPTVKGVLFRIEGQPVTALGGEGLLLDTPQTPADYEDVTPFVLVTSPLPGDTVSCPLRATGTSNVFEASSLLGVVASNETPPPADDPTIVTATSGTGTRGTFDVQVPCTAPEDGTGFLVSWWDSAKDGSHQGVEYIPLVFR